MHVLVVDDSRSARHNLRMILDALGGVTVHEAASLRDTLLPKLLSGELSVASFERGVPA